MKQILLLYSFFLSVLLNAQGFHYKSSLPYGVTINDAIELNGKYYLVGNIDSVGTQRPYFGILDNAGSLIFNSTLNAPGRFVNIHEVNNILHVSAYYSFSPSFNSFLDLQFDTNFVIKTGVDLGIEVLQKSKLIDDSTIMYVAYEPPAFNTLGNAVVYKQGIPDSSVYFGILPLSLNPFKVYDIVSPTPGVYHLFTNSPDGLFSDQVTVHYLDDSLLSYRSKQLFTSYNQFGSTARVIGPVSAEVVNGNVLVNAIVDHPTYFNQVNTLDMALVRYDTNYNELSASYTGKVDTNYTTSLNSISVTSNNILSGGNTNLGSSSLDELVISQHDLSGSLIQSVHYADGSKLTLKKLLQLPNNEFLIIGNTSNQFFVIQTDSLGNLPTRLLELSLKNTIAVDVFPNPTADFFQIDLKGDVKLEQFYLYNLNGELIKSGVPINRVVDVNDLTTGSYFIIIQTDQGIASKKVIVLR